MPIKIRSAVLALIPVAGIMVLAGCGGDGGPDPSISREDAQTLLAGIQEIEDNVEVGSCIVASDRTDQLISDIGELPDGVDEDVRQALDNGANNLRLLLADPDQCEREETTVETTTEEEPTTTEEEETTTRETTTRPEQTQTQTTPTQTQTQTQTTQTNPSGGVGPGSSGGL
ncbi:MAG TPA: hypothetical protein VFY33_00075 [Solirubrobacterales bacterium]|nr:hypothetical protein [Solirubrobacterales bacterium]